MGFISANTGDGNFTVYVKYNAKAGRWYTKKDEKDAPEYEVQNLTAVFDMENIKTGWYIFAPGVAPIKEMNPDFMTWEPSPGKEFKQGFELNVFSEKNMGGVREFASTATIVKESMNDLYDAWAASRGANPGKLPVVKCVGVSAVTGSHGTNYKPHFEIVSWAARPEAFGGVPGTAEPAAAAPPPPPPAAKTAATVGADDTEF